MSEVPDEVHTLRREAGDARVALRAAEERVKDLRDRSPVKRAEGERDVAERAALAAEREVTQLEICLEVGLDIKLADRLVGDTVEELLDDAERLRKVAR
jgi:hypothetical protein